MGQCRAERAVLPCSYPSHADHVCSCNVYRRIISRRFILPEKSTMVATLVGARNSRLGLRIQFFNKASFRLLLIFAAETLGLSPYDVDGGCKIVVSSRLGQWHGQSEVGVPLGQEGQCCLDRKAVFNGYLRLAILAISVPLFCNRSQSAILSCRRKLQVMVLGCLHT